MRIFIDEKLYTLNLSPTVDLAKEIYRRLNNEGIVDKNGNLVKIGERSLFRTAIKSFLTPIVIPFVRKMYEERGIILDPPIKHTDLIDYVVYALFEYVQICERRLDVNLTSEISTDSSNAIKSISATWQTDTLAIDSTSSEIGDENQ